MKTKLTNREQLYLTLIKVNKSISIKRLQGYLYKDRTTIQKTLSTLLHKGYIKRNKINSTRGWKYIYSLK